MHGPYCRRFVHPVWAAWERLPLISEGLESRLYRCIQRDAQRLGCEVVSTGGIEDHVHGLGRCSAAVSISALVKQLKGPSSHLAHHHLAPGEFFKWQGGCGAISVAECDPGIVRQYIAHQREASPDRSPERHPATYLHPGTVREGGRRVVQPRIQSPGPSARSP